jgi:hypothetical protein
MRDPREVDSFFVYSYHHLDDLEFLRDPVPVLADVWGAKNGDEWLSSVAGLFRRHGWEGDGELRILWLPPFVDVGVEDTWGTYLWVVKQRNNGTTFIASPIELPFRRLLAQNTERPVWKGLVPVGKASSARETLVDTVAKIDSELDADLLAIAASGEREQWVRSALLERAQGRLVQALHEFFDDCYLKLLIDVITEGNRSGLKLKKSSVRLVPSEYVPDDGSNDTDGWFTLRGLVSDMWHDYKFQPFDSKVDMLFSPVNFPKEPSTLLRLRQHVFLRNCVQHHEGRVDGRGLPGLGCNTIELAGPGGAKNQLKAWTRIEFPREEVRALRQTIHELALSFDRHVAVRIVTREYAKVPEDA